MNRIKRQFKLLRSIIPDASRKANFRRVLESRVLLESSALPARSMFAYIGRHMRTVPALALVITLIGSGSGVSFAAQNAIPGETLYGIKIATEQVRIAVTPGKKTKAELHLGFASRRLREIEQLIEQNGAAHAAVSETLVRYENELDESEALATQNQALAQIITPIISEATESHKQILKRVAQKAHASSFDGDFDDEFDDAYEHAESKDDAVLYAAFVATSTPPAMIPPMIKERSRKKWESVEYEMKKMESSRVVLPAPQNNDVVATKTADAFTTAQERIDEAKTRWENGEYREALKHSIEARELMKEAGKIEKEKRKEREENKQREESRDEDEDEN